ncbi:MAG: TetR/AcrR family transcriptional regulator [Lachnospiraceae bacterium]|nr:TetR/AcrR family transcriptional regulator [Lachnospiraceae bacterium]MBR1852475.1 TetR/AcrR family transcriptional regulator [Lachnospiraceae bacterium]
MARDKTESHIRIVEAARKEFLEYGYNDASMRRIAANANIQVSGLYKHFANKEEMFASLVAPVIDGFYALYHRIEKDYFDGVGQADAGDSHYDWVSQNEAVRAMEYIYDNLDGFNLLILKSQGTKYEDFIHEVAKLEEEVTLRYMDELRKKGYAVKKIDSVEFHLLTTSYIESFFQPLTHGLDREKALHYAATLEEFYEPAWKAWFGI